MTANLPDSLLLVSIGACAYLALVRLWLGFPARGPSAWAGVWALLAVVFASARFAQMHTADPGIAIAMARLANACSPLLIASLVIFTRTLTETRVRRPWLTPYSALAFAACALLTPWFASDQIYSASALGGRSYLGVVSGPAQPLLGAAIALALGVAMRMIVRSRALSGADKRLLGCTLIAYAGFGASTLASSLGWLASPGFGEYGPLFVTVSSSVLLARRQASLEASLASQVASRTKQREESEARLRRVIDHAPIGILVVDAAGQLQLANHALLETLGSTQQEFESAFNVVEDAAAQRSGFASMLKRALETGAVLSDEFEFKSWWGKSLRTRVTVAPFRGAAGAIAGGLALVEDLTERRAFERRLQRAQRLEAVGQLAAGIAHEINNPMAYVRSNLSVLAEELAALGKALPAGEAARPSDACAAGLRELESRRADSLASVQRIVAIVRDLREFSRASGGPSGATPVNAQLEHAARLASTRADGLSEVALELGDVAPVAIDADALRQVLLNLLTHAQQAAGPQGRVRASTARMDGAVLISVHDDGPRIRPEDRERLFEPFATTRGASEPTLGLYVSHQIVREHEGKIDVLSSEAHGTSFVVRLPIAPEPDPPDAKGSPDEGGAAPR